MAILLPRLRFSKETMTKLRQEADESGLSNAALITDILERHINNTASKDETLFRTLMVAERYGLTIGETRLFPASWVDVGKLDEATCRDLAARYVAWRRTQDENKPTVGR